MKKLSNKRQEWLIRNKKKNSHEINRLASFKKISKIKTKRSRFLADVLFKVVAPTHFKYYDGDKQRRILDKFFKSVNSNLEKGNKVRIDLSKVKQLYPCGVLILMGWVDEWNKNYPGKITSNYPINDLVEQMLCHVKVLEKFGLKKRKDSSHNDVLKWHYMHDNNADATVIEAYLIELQKVLGEEKQIELGGCISEAMTNVKHHAYQDGKPSPWWIFSTVSENKIFIGLHDRGMTIPKTVLQKPNISERVKFFKFRNSAEIDNELIAAAVGGRTRTGLPYRGRGLSEMLDFTKKYPGSELGIFSNLGFFRFSDREYKFDLSARLRGTLIIWQVNLSEELK